MFLQRIFSNKKECNFSEFEIFKYKKIAKKVFALNFELTQNKEKAKEITKKQLQEVYSLDKNRFNTLYTKYLRVN